MRLCITLFTLAGLSACNTIQGLGEDLQNGGLAIEEAAEAAQYEQPQPAPRRAAPTQTAPANTYYY